MLPCLERCDPPSRSMNFRPNSISNALLMPARTLGDPPGSIRLFKWSGHSKKAGGAFGRRFADWTTGISNACKRIFAPIFGAGFAAGPPLERVLWSGELNEQQIFLYFPAPAEGFRFQPLSSEGLIGLEGFSAQRLSSARSIFTAIHRKLRLLREYNCTLPVIGRGLKLLFTGRLREIYRKLFKALPDTRRYNPVTDAYLQSVAGQGRWRVPLSGSERQHLQEECDSLAVRPPVAVVLPVHDAAALGLVRAVDTVVKQIYTEWELHIVFAADAPSDQIRIADNLALRHEGIRVTVAANGGDIDEALADVLDRIESEHVVFLQAGFELCEGALLALMQKRLAEPACGLILNSAKPAECDDERPLLSGSTFRAGAAGQQLNLYRLADLKAFRRLPSFRQSSIALGAEIARQMPITTRTTYLPDLLAYPISCLTTLPPGKSEYKPASQPTRSILLTGNIDGISGWSYVVHEIACGFHSLGACVRLNAASHHSPDLLPPYLLQARRPRRAGDLEIVLAPPHQLVNHPHPPKSVIFTMWESDRLEPAWVKMLNQAALVLVPSQWGIDSFRASGVKTPMEIVPLGHDSLTFHSTAAWPEVCTFGTAAALWGGGIRKNTAQLIRAFSRAFPNEPDVRLRVKITPRCELAECLDPRVEIERNFMPPGELAEWYRSLTAFVNSSSAEGFGLHLLEAMACGRPVVSTAYSAVTEYFDETVGFPFAHRLTAADKTIYNGQWAELDEDELVRVLRHVYDNEAEARMRGQAAAARTRRFTWKEAGQRLIAALESHTGERLAA